MRKAGIGDDQTVLRTEYGEAVLARNPADGGADQVKPGPGSQ